MTLHGFTKMAAVAGMLVSVSLLIVLDRSLDNSWQSAPDRLVGWTVGIAITTAPFVVAFALVDRSTARPDPSRRCLLLLVAIAASIVLAFFVRPDPNSVHGADGLQILAASLYQGLFVGAAAAVSDAIDAVAKRQA